jgi:cobalt-zinc-cadmium efflux system membrane fusion protein
MPPRSLVTFTLLIALAGCHEAARPAAEPAEAEPPRAQNQVTLSAEAQRQAGVAVRPAERREIERELATTGELEANADHQAHVHPRVAGRVVALTARVGDRVRKGQVLARLESVALGEAQADFLDADARHLLARTTYERQRTLLSHELTAKKEVQAAEHQLRLSEIELDKARNQLALLGVGRPQLDKLARSRKLEPDVPVLAPIAGTVIMRHATLGDVLEPMSAEPAFVLSDVSRLWATATLYERDLASVRRGQAATITTPAYPGKEYKGRVDLISTTMDPATRTATARIEVANADEALKPEMFANVRIAVGRQQAVVVPTTAVLLEKGKTFAFVRKDATTFEVRSIEVGPPVGGVQPVQSGLQAGEPVVFKGGFTLKSELLHGSFAEEE